MKFVECSFVIYCMNYQQTKVSNYFLNVLRVGDDNVRFNTNLCCNEYSIAIFIRNLLYFKFMLHQLILPSLMRKFRFRLVLETLLS